MEGYDSDEEMVLREDMEVRYKLDSAAMVRSTSNESLVSLEDELLDSSESDPVPSASAGAGSGSPGVATGLRKRKTSSAPLPEEEEVKSGESDGLQRAITRKKELFVVPETRDCLERLLDWESWSASEYIRVGMMVCSLVAGFFAPAWTLVVAYVFWRLMYDLVLGIMLRNQSRRRSLSRAYREAQAAVADGSASSLQAKVYTWGRYLAIGSMSGSPRYKEGGAGFDMDSVPVDCQTWLVFREFADVVLNMDAMTHAVFCLRYFEAPASFGFWAVVRYVLGAALIVFSFWAKKDALRVVKDYAWYWGDTFFLLTDVELRFDGVFEMFPHPMYTVGYGFYYGLALMSHSYTVLYISIWGHCCQLMFLSLVEDPHIQRTFGSASPPSRNPAALEAYISKDLILLANFNPLRGPDLATLLMVGQVVATAFMGFSSTFYFVVAVCWRLFHVFLTGAILVAQSKSQWWIRASGARGIEPPAAFANWKQVYNISLLMAHASFIVAALCVSWSESDFTFGPLLARIPIAAILFAINMWAVRSSLDVLGEYGWFYGDFFIPPTDAGIDLEYSGIYRFLNNPDSLTGFLWYYGLGILVNEPAMVFFAVFAQVTHWLFVIFVEKPHMAQAYGDRERSESGIQKHLTKATLRLFGERRNIQKIVTFPLTEKLNQSASIITRRAAGSLSELTQSAGKISAVAKDMLANPTLSETVNRVKSKILPEPLEAEA